MSKKIQVFLVFVLLSFFVFSTAQASLVTAPTTFSTTTNFVGNVGIGVTGPTRKLEVTSLDAGLYVQGAGQAPWTQNIAEFRYGGNSNAVVIRAINGVAALTTGSAVPLYLSSNGMVNQMTLATTSNVGIGTIVPGALLDVNKENAQSLVRISRGGSDIGASVDVGGLEFYQDYSASPIIMGGIYSRSTAASGLRGALDFRVKSTSGSQVTGLYLNGTDAGVNVGVGTTNPTQKLEVQEGVLKFGGTTGYSHGILMDRGPAITTTNLQSSIFNEWNGLGNAESLTSRAYSFKWEKDDGTDWMAINSSGNLSVGTTTFANAKLTILPNGQTYAIDAGNYRIGNVALPLIAGDVVTLAYLQDYANPSSSDLWNGTTTGNIWNANSGNVGIGTTAPTGKLFVGSSWRTAYGGTDLYVGAGAGIVSTSNLGITYSVSDASTTTPGKVGLTLYNDDTTAGGWSPLLLFSKAESGSSPYKATMAGIAAKAPLGTGNGDSWIDGELHFYTSGAATAGLVDRMVINKDGNVGIGNTNPLAKMHLGSGTPSHAVVVERQLYVSSDAEFDGYTYFDGPVYFNASDLQIMPHLYFSEEGSELKYASDYNAVFATNSNRHLNFDHAAPTNPTIYIQSALNPDVSNNEWVSFTHDANNFKITTGANTGVGSAPATVDNGIIFSPRGTEAMRIIGNGNVGIGTTGPLYQLEVSKVSGAGVVSLKRNQTVLTSQDVVGSVLFSSNDANLNGSTYPYDIAKIDVISSAGSVGAVGTDMRFFTNYDYLTTATEKMRIDRSGNVGIGTTTPAARLEVVDNAAVVYSILADDKRIGNISLPSLASDAATKGYVDAAIPLTASLWNGTLAGHIWKANVGNVGIGTTNPAGPLNIVKAAGDNTIYADNYSTTGGNSNYWFSRRSHSNTNGTLATTLTGDAIGTFFFQGVNSSNAFAYGAKIIAQQNGAAGTYIPTDLNFSTYSATAQNSNQLVLSANGNVGIGTVSPVADLHIGSGSLGYITRTRMIIQPPNHTGGPWKIDARDDSSKAYLDIHYGSAVGMTMNSNANVGIGTTTPANRLHIYEGASGGTPYEPGGGLTIERNGRPALQFLSPNTTDQYIFFGDPQAANRAWVGYNHVTDQLLLHTGGTTYMDGNVGIGTSTPGYKLDVTGSINSGGIGVNGSLYLNSAADGLGGGSLVYSNVSNTLTLGQNRGVASKILLSAAGIELQTEDSSSPYSKVTRIIVKHGDAGLIGIGTTTLANAKLTIVPNGQTYAIDAGNYKIGNVAIPSAAADVVTLAYLQGYADPSSSDLWNGTTTGNIWNANSGNVGIGTTNPSSGKLQIYQGNAVIDSTVFTTTTRNNGYHVYTDRAFGMELGYGQTGQSAGWALNVFGRTTDATAIRFGKYASNSASSTGFTELMTILTNGNVGIGTTTPSSKLQVGTELTGDGSESNYITIGKGWNAASGIQWSRQGIKDTLVHSDLNENLVFETDATNAGSFGNFIFKNSGSELLRFTYDGNVGIGTTSPSAKLDIMGSTSIGAQLLTIGSDSSGNIIKILSTGLNASTYGARSNATLNVGGYGSTPSIWTRGGAVFAETYGNVGIGTTNPGTKLEVNGIFTTRNGSPQFYSVGNANRRWTYNLLNGDLAKYYYYDEVATTFHSIQLGGTSAAGSGLVVTGAGNVGIGTTVPNSKLQVGGINGGSTEPSGTLALYNSTGQSSLLFVSKRNDVATTQNVGGIFGEAGPGWVSKFHFMVNNDWGNPTIEALTISSTAGVANVGIGTTSPTQRLEVVGTGYSILAGSQKIGNVAVPSVAADVVTLGYLQSYVNASSSDLWSGTKDGNIWNGTAGAGKVGVGITSPSANFHVASPGTTNSANNVVEIGENYTNMNHTMLNLQGSAMTSSGYFLTAIDGNSGLYKFVVRGDGNVAIGTSSPSALLDVFGAPGKAVLSTAASTAPAAGTILGTLGFRNTSYSIDSAYIHATTEGAWNGGDYPTALAFYTTTDGAPTPSEKVRINNAGSVGIGTSTPSDVLHIYKSGVTTDYAANSIAEGVNLRISNPGNNWGGVAGLIFENSGAVAGTGYAKIGATINDTSDSDLFFQISNAGTIAEGMRIASTGNVGIGTTGPNQKLDVNGVITAVTGFRVNNAAGTAGNYLRSNGTNFVVANIQVADVPTLNQHTTGYAGNLIYEDNRTISPSELVANRLRFGFTSYTNNNSSPYADFIHLRSYQDSSGGLDNLLVFNKSTGLGMRLYQQAWGSSTAYTTFKDIVLANNTPTANYLTKYASVGNTVSVANSVVYDNGTNVGIGITSPAAKLEVVGTGYSILAGSQKIGNVAVPSAAADVVTLGYLQSYVNASSSDLWSGAKDGNIWNGAAGAGKVGVGITSPSANFHVASPLTTNSANNVVEIGENYTNMNHTMLNLQGSAMTSSGYFLTARDGASGLYKFVVRGDGAVGVGTSTPATELVVVGTETLTGSLIAGGGSDSNWATLNAGGTQSINAHGSIYSYNSVCVNNNSGSCNSTGGVVIGITNTSSAINIPSAANTIFNNGYSVGIGTTNPKAKLESVIGVNANPATSGTTQTGGALRLRGGDNAVLDFGMNSVNTWIQATDLTDLNQKYNLNLNPNGGSVGIGTTNSNFDSENLALDAKTYISYIGTSNTSTSIAPGVVIHNSGNVSGPATLVLAKSRSTVEGLINANDEIGSIAFASADSGEFLGGASIVAVNDGTAANDDAGAHLDFRTSINYNAMDVVNTKMRITSGGNVGIGTNAPEAKLDVRNAVSIGTPITGVSGVYNLVVNGADAGIFLRRSGSVNEPFIYLSTDTTTSGGQLRGLNAGGLRMTNYTGATEWMRIAANGNVGIGTSNPGSKLEVNGTSTAIAFLTLSDVRYKTNIKKLTNVLEKIQSIEAVTFDWKQKDFPNKNFSGGRQIGFIAQNVEKEFPELVSTDANGYKEMMYDRFSSVLFAAVKEQQAEIKGLESRIKVLEKSLRKK